MLTSKDYLTTEKYFEISSNRWSPSEFDCRNRMHPDVLHRDMTPQPYSVQTHTNTICSQVRYTCILEVVGNFTDGLYNKIQTLELKKILACFKINYTSNLVQPSYKGKLQDTYISIKDNYTYAKNEMTRLFQNSNLNALVK